MEKAVRGMRRLGLKIDRILTSPLTRARQTAEIVAAGLGLEKALYDWDELGPAYREGVLLSRLRQLGAKDRVLLVGHEPDMGLFSSFLVCGKPESILEFKKGALCEIRFEGKPESGQGWMTWYLLNKHLRLLGEAK
jgi:phosphohistidine phosphatase